MKLKKAARRVNRSFFGLCLVPFDIFDKNAKMSSVVINESSMSPNEYWKLSRAIAIPESPLPAPGTAENTIYFPAAKCLVQPAFRYSNQAFQAKKRRYLSF